MEQYPLEVKNLSLTYHSRGNLFRKDVFYQAVTDVSFHLEKGEVLKFGQVILGERVKRIIPNKELPPAQSKAIEILSHNIDQYCISDYKDKRIARKLRRCKDKLEGQLKRIKAGRMK